MGQITLQGVQKSFGPVHIIKGVDLDIADGSFVVFVGPSGCGKSTLLRLIAGLEDVTGGKILIDGKNVVDVPPAKRGLSMVFQSYALYPHMSVRGNIAFGLKMAGLPKDGDQPQGRGGRGDPQPHALSRPQAARTLRRPAPARRDRPRDRARAEGLPVRRAAVQSRRRACACRCGIEITRLQKQLGTTAIYVTHDQVEAMTMADKIVVLNAGKIEQDGSPLELYEQPANLFVAGFIGSPKMNFITGETAHQRGAATIGVRPEHLKVDRGRAGLAGNRRWSPSISAAIPSSMSMPARSGRSRSRYIGELNLSAGDKVSLSPDPARIHRFDRQRQRHPGVSSRNSGENGEDTMYLEKFKLGGKTPS